jgi:hypothetical protein
MCMVSSIGDNWANGFPGRWPGVVPNPQPSITDPFTTWPNYTVSQYATKAELQELRNEIQELKELLLAAKKFDETTNQPDCHMDEKVALIKAIAKLVNVDMKDIFPD